MNLFLVCTNEGKHEKTSKAFFEYVKWLEQAHTIRITRIDLVHGRQGVEPNKLKMANEIGMPASPEQKSTLYSIN